MLRMEKANNITDARNYLHIKFHYFTQKKNKKFACCSCVEVPKEVPKLVPSRKSAASVIEQIAKTKKDTDELLQCKSLFPPRTSL